MIQSKKIKLFLAAIIISVVMTLLPLQTEAKDKIYLNRTKITLNVGQTKKLSLIRNKKNVKKKIKKKIKWVSGNRKKVSVDRKGVIRALHSGKAKITAKYQGKKYACKKQKTVRCVYTDTDASTGANVAANCTNFVAGTAANTETDYVSK